jgi:hypothetical protein
MITRIALATDDGTTLDSGFPYEEVHKCLASRPTGRKVS